jgi:hypothetical protein
MCCGSSLPNFRIFYCTISKGCEGMDFLQLCAQKYAELCYYTYDCTIARKNTAIDLHFTFSPYEFRHLAGLHRLEHDRLRSNSERVFKDILSGKLTLADLRQAHNWSTESEKILSRLEALSQLDTLMDEFLLLYGFSGEKLASQTPPLRTKIDADYLIKYQLPSGITFFFSVKQKDGYCGRSLFINNELDYSRGQTKFTLLEKTKTNLRTSEQILLYRRSTYQK